METTDLVQFRDLLPQLTRSLELTHRAYSKRFEGCYINTFCCLNIMPQVHGTT